MPINVTIPGNKTFVAARYYVKDQNGNPIDVPAINAVASGGQSVQVTAGTGPDNRQITTQRPHNGADTFTVTVTAPGFPGLTDTMNVTQQAVPAPVATTGAFQEPSWNPS